MTANFSFSTQWLDLREPFDQAARDPAVVCFLEPALVTQRDQTLTVVDLGAGTGANLRYLAPRLHAPQEWLLVDSDARLLQAGRERLRAWAAARGYAIERQRPGAPLHFAGSDVDCRVRFRVADLNAEGEAIEVGLTNRTLITAAALLDLVSAAWLQRLVDRAAHAGAMLLFALNYTGQFHYTPPDPEDESVRQLFNRHQNRDKGFGPALGPGSRPRLARLLAESGYQTQFAPSDWQMLPHHRELQRALLEGWLRAALEVAPERRVMLEAWARRREATIGQGGSQLRVGHFDVVGVPQPS